MAARRCIRERSTSASSASRACSPRIGLARAAVRRWSRSAAPTARVPRVAMLERILRAAGYRVGAFTSPHLLRLQRAHPRRRRAMLADDALVAAFERVDAARGDTTADLSSNSARSPRC
ncbi:MAG: hypothetical protein MZV65_34245 [Chromatiales bacterium]|nr:hypothetical protein [Chromatiales bacterium]